MYGETSGMLREALGELLRQHRIQQRIGGPGQPRLPVTTALQERREIGEQIGRYRRAVLTWCHQSLQAASPRTTLEGTTVHTRGPVDELRLRVHHTLDSIQTSLPTPDELVTTQSFGLLDTWRHAARASVLGEHDLGHGLTYAQLSPAQSLTIVKDAADVTRAVLALDRRYAHIPGWEPLKGPGRLARAAQACATWTGPGEPDYSVDHLGWQPAPTLIEGPGLPGIGGVLQAQHNLLLHLRTFPTARNLRLILESQRILSHEAARLCSTDPELAATWKRRGSAYGRLVRATRDLGGLVGGGGPAAGQAALAATRIQNHDKATAAQPLEVRLVHHVSTGIDARLGHIIEQGLAQRLYLQAITFPGLDSSHGEEVYVTQRRFIPVTTSLHAELLAVVRDARPATPPRLRAPTDGALNRRDFEAALQHRPLTRGATPDAPSM